MMTSDNISYVLMIMAVTLTSLGINEVFSIVWSIVFDRVSNTYSAFTCSKLKIETLEQGVKYVQS